MELGLEKGCMYCKNLIHNEALTNFECKLQPYLKLKNIGVCMQAEIKETGDTFIVGNCFLFEDKN